MNSCDCDPLAFTTAVNTLAAAIAAQLNDNDLALMAAVLTQLGDTLETIAAQRAWCAPRQGVDFLGNSLLENPRNC